MRFKPAQVFLVVAFALASLGCGHTPDGFTPETWGWYKNRYPNSVKAVEFIQNSARRRAQRDVYLRYFHMKSDGVSTPAEIEGHAASVVISPNRMTGGSSWTMDMTASLVYVGTEVHMERSQSSFGEMLILELERKLQSLQRDKKAIEEDASQVPRELLQEVDRVKAAIEKIRSLEA